MAAPQLNGFHFPSVTQVEPPSSHPPPPPPLPTTTTTTTSTPPSQEGPDHHQHHHVYRPQPHSYPHNHTPSPPEGEASQPLDLRVTRGILLPETKRSAESDSEEHCVKRARVEVVANPSFTPSALENRTGSQISVSSPYEFYSHNHCSLPYYYHHHHSPGRDKEKSQSETPQHFTSSSTSVDNGLSPYYHQQDKRLYGPESAVSCSDGKHQESASSSSAGISLGLPIPHSSVFTRSVSPLFQQSWHHSPMSVSSHAHHTLFHAAAAAAATTVSPHLHPDLFHQPPPLPLSSCSSSSSGVQQQGLLSSPIAASLHDGHGNLIRHPSPLSAYAQVNGGFPYTPQEVLPSGQSLLPSSHGQSLVPSPSQSVLPPPPPPPGNLLLPSPGHSLLLPPPSQNGLPSHGQNVLPSPGQTVVPSPGQSVLSSPQVSSPSLPKSDPCFTPKDTVPQEAVTRQNTSPSSQHDTQPSPPQEKQQEPVPSQSVPQNSGVSPRPFYRPFEDNMKPPTQVPPPTAPAPVEREGYRSHHEVPASYPSVSVSSSATSMSAYTSEEACPKSSADPEQTKTGEEEGGMGATVSPQDEAKDKQNVIQQSVSTSHSGFASFPGQSMDTSSREFYTQTAKASTCTECSEADCSSSGNQNVSTKAKTSPIQDNAVLSSTSSSRLDPLFTKPFKGTGRKPEAQPIKIIGTTPLARIREERAKQEAKAREERLREFIAHRQEYRNNGGGSQPSGMDNSSDREASPKTSSDDTDGGWGSVSSKNTDRAKGQSGVVGADMDGSEQSSSASKTDPDEEAVPSSSQGELSSQSSEASQDAKRASQTNSTRTSPGLSSDIHGGRSEACRDLPSSSSCGGDSSSKSKPASSDAPVPPDPNIKITPLDYLISKVLVEKIDVPFKPENREIRDIYTGAKKGRLTLVDLIELQVEASLKA